MIGCACHEPGDRTRRMRALGATLVDFPSGVEQAVHRPHTADVGAFVEQRRMHLRGRRIVESRLVQDGERRGDGLRREGARRAGPPWPHRVDQRLPPPQRRRAPGDPTALPAFLGRRSRAPPARVRRTTTRSRTRAEPRWPSPQSARPSARGAAPTRATSRPDTACATA